MKGIIGIAAWLVACAPAPRDGGTDGGDETDDMATDATDADMADDGVVSEETTFVYANTSESLYRVDPATFAISLVGDFRAPNGTPITGITDIAVNKDQVMIAVSFGSTYRVDPMTAEATYLAPLGIGDFNGLSFVPAAMLGLTGDDVLVATRNADDVVFRVDPMTGTGTQVGTMGGFRSSGDIVSVNQFGTVQTTVGAPFDVLTTLAPNTFTGSAPMYSTGFDQIWGLAFWRGVVLGFTQTGQFLTIDPATGVATLVESDGPAWWGAAVTTAAPVVQ
jgi:hypothetical protein